MASLDILCFNPFNLKNKIMKIEHKKIFSGPSNILRNISWPINICSFRFYQEENNQQSFHYTFFGYPVSYSMKGK